jgi:hypothetical protein
MPEIFEELIADFTLKITTLQDNSPKILPEDL